MAYAVKLSDLLVKKAKIYANTFNRSTAGQIEYWAKIGQLLEENPDISYAFLQNILISLEEVKTNQVENYVFGEGNDS